MRWAVVVVLLAGFSHHGATQAPAATATVTIDYPAEGTLFPPDLTPPTMLWRDRSAAVAWRIGMRARTRTGGAEGRIAALEKGGKRATLEAGGLRITVAVEDLELAVGGETEASRPENGRSAGVRPRPLEPTINASASRLQLERARTVATSLDLRGATVGEALEVLDRYLDDASLAGLSQATVIHGMGTGALRDAVRDHVSGHPLVGSWRPGGRGEGGDGATVVGL